MNNKQRQEIIDYLEQGGRFKNMLIMELDRADISDSEKRTYSSLLDAILGSTELYCCMTEWPDNVAIFIPKEKRINKNDSEAAIIISHGPETMRLVKDVSDYLNVLPLSTEQNDRLLVDMMTKQLLMAEHEQYLAGFSDCMKVIQEGGFKGLEDKLEAIITSEKE